MADFDPTAFARVGGADLQPRLGTSLINAAQAGAQERRSEGLHGQLLEQNEQAIEARQRALAKETGMDKLQKQIQEAYRDNDVKGFQLGMQQLGAIDPAAAGQVQALYGGMDKTNRVEAAHYLFGAANMGDSLEESNQMLGKAAETLGPEDPFTIGINKIMNMPLGEERDAEILGSIQMAKDLGYLPGLAAKEKAATAVAVEQEKETRKSASEIRRAMDNQLKDFRQTRRAFGRIEAAAKRSGPAASLAMVFNYMKMLDPNSVVRESEFKTAADAKAFIEKVDNGAIKINPEAAPGVSWVRRMAVGEVLNDEQKKDFLNMSMALNTKARTDADLVLGEMVQRANQEGVTGERLLGKKRFSEYQQRSGGDTPNVTTQAEFDALPSGATYMEDGVKYKKP